MQQRPFHLGLHFLCLRVLKGEHFKWNQDKQWEHWTAGCLRVQGQEHDGQMKGPGFCSVPAINSNSRSSFRLAYFVVRQIKKMMEFSHDECSAPSGALFGRRCSHGVGVVSGRTPLCHGNQLFHLNQMIINKM